MKAVSRQLNKILGSAAAYKMMAFLILVALMVGTYNANQSYAWFTDQENVPFSLESGKVHYEVKYTTSGGLMVPGKNLFTGFTLTNKSSIDTNVRLQVEYTVWEKGTGTPETATSSTAIYTTNAAISAGVVAIDKQYLNLSMNTTGADGFQPVQITPPGVTLATTWWTRGITVGAVTKGALESGVEVPVFNTADSNPFLFCYDGPKTHNVFAAKPVTITIHLQAKQADHVEWADLTMIETFQGKN